MDLPWLDDTVARLPASLPGALLLYGQKGIGKELLGEALSQSVLCRAATGPAKPCRRCEDCHLFEIGNHPDFRKLQPQKSNEEAEGERPEPARAGSRSGTRISVEMVRDLTDLLAVAAHRGGARVVLIAPAESLNVNAANALLKMLEEPGEGTHFILVAHERNRIIPTIRSRCFQLSVSAPLVDIAQSWLESHGVARAKVALGLASYAPLAARELSDDDAFWDGRARLLGGLTQRGINPVQLAQAVEKLDPVIVGRLLGMYVFDMLALKSGARVRYNTDLAADIERAARAVSPKDLCRWSDEIRNFTRSAEHPLNRQLALESLFIAWPGAAAR